MRIEDREMARPAAAAGEEFAARYGQRLLRAALILCRDEVEAQDLVQEALCQALAHLGDFRGESSPYTWLYAIMRHLYFRQRRRHGLWRFWLQSPSWHVDSICQPTPEHDFDRHAAAEQLWTAMSRLPLRQREILLLRYVEGLKIPEIASLLALASGTVKSRLHHATRRLQREFAPSWGAPPLPAKE